jgi:FkbM family methyltransferase
MLITTNSISYEVKPGFSIHDTADYWNLVNTDMWEPETFEILKQYLSKEYSYFDIGAWVGPTVLFGAQLAKKCYAFEPDPVAFNALAKNLSLNPNIQGVRMENAAISSTTGFAQMGAKITPGDSMSSLLWAEQTWTVPCFSLGDYFEQNKIDDCNFIKMDIEGGEAFALAAANNFFREFHPTLYLSLHTPWISDKAGFFNNLSETLAGYKNIYYSNGQRISFSELSNNPNFTTILATSE